MESCYTCNVANYICFNVQKPFAQYAYFTTWSISSKSIKFLHAQMCSNDVLQRFACRQAQTSILRLNFSVDVIE